MVLEGVRRLADDGLDEAHSGTMNLRNNLLIMLSLFLYEFVFTM